MTVRVNHKSKNFFPIDVQINPVFATAATTAAASNVNIGMQMQLEFKTNIESSVINVEWKS